MVKEECGGYESVKTCEACGKQNQARFAGYGCYGPDVNQACTLFDKGRTDYPTHFPTVRPSLSPTKSTSAPTLKPTYASRGTPGVWDDDMALETPGGSISRKDNGCLLVYEQLCGPGRAPKQCLTCALQNRAELLDAKCYQSDVFEICHAGLKDEGEGTFASHFEQYDILSDHLWPYSSDAAAW
jgi:hypothetical protein